LVLVYGLLGLMAAAEPAKQDFEADAVGHPPATLEFARTGGGAEGKWVVRTEKGADKITFSSRRASTPPTTASPSPCSRV
jgi:hypothetical protein